MTTYVSDLTCEHGILLAAWCGQCAHEWVPESPDSLAPPQPGRDQSAA